MIVALENIQLFIGANSDNEQALNLSLLSNESLFYCFDDGQQALASFCYLEQNEKNTPKIDRCVHLIEQVLAKLPPSEKNNLSDSPVFLLLPAFEKNIHDELSEDFDRFVHALSKAFPQLFSHALSQCFPFGRAAFSIALKSAVSLLSSNTTSNIVLLAVDSLYDKMPELAESKKLISTEQTGCIIPSEGAVICNVLPSTFGLSIDTCLQNIVPEKQVKQGISSLFSQASAYLTTQADDKNVSKKNSQVTISSLYLPGNGSEEQQSWLEAYFYLADNISTNTQIYQNTLYTGELGSVTGLYNFLHIYNGYQSEWLAGITGQLEVSDALYQGFTLYSWTGTT
ncbi:hypothetical protein [Pseudocolwellia agarivorans]|uniref:hypothetical protein n=1 Tax=Pseudocolwellia agarivorans TaxID=1911682 RepID=UPI000987B192|nr:hypothetical protein [Pseudocolwellia agarivorans]